MQMRLGSQPFEAGVSFVSGAHHHAYLSGAPRHKPYLSRVPAGVTPGSPADVLTYRHDVGIRLRRVVARTDVCGRRCAAQADGRADAHGTPMTSSSVI